MSLKVWLPLNGDLTQQGASMIQASDTNVTINANGKIGSCYTFNGSSSYIQLSEAPLNNSTAEFSFTCWFKPTHAHNGCLFSNRTKTDSTGITLFYYTNQIIFDTYNRWHFTPATSITINQWNHLTFTYKKGDKKKLYLNGILINETAASGTAPTSASASNAFIGGSQNSQTTVNDNWLSGALNDVRIYDHCLSAAEVREISQGLVLHYKLDNINNGIQDSSGYNHNGTITGTIVLDSDTPRYNNSSYFDGSSYILTPSGSFAWNDLTQLTFSAWMKPTASMTGWRGSVGIAADASQTSRGIAITDYANEFRGTYTNGSTYATVSTGKTLTQNEWHHCAGTLKGTEFKLYHNGILVKTETINWGTATLNTNARFEVGVDIPGTDEKFTGNYSDVRCYCTALDADAIRQLYEVSAKVDNKQNFHTFELIETNKQEITKQGQVKGQNLLETYLPLYDKNIYTEPDGSTWIHIFHHNNPAASKFNEPTLDWTTGKYLDADRWYDVDQAMYHTLSPYELMVKQKTTNTATETKYRWIQTANPLTATWADVKPGTVTFNTSSGYTNSSYGGMYLFKNTNLHMCIANGSNGNWFGGIGAAAAYNNGIPGFPNTTVTSGYIDLYMRVYVGTKIIKEIGINSSEFIEF